MRKTDQVAIINPVEADTRRANRRLRNERTGKPDCQLVIEWIKRARKQQLQTYAPQLGGPLKGDGGYTPATDLTSGISCLVKLLYG